MVYKEIHEDHGAIKAKSNTRYGLKRAKRKKFRSPNDYSNRNKRTQRRVHGRCEEIRCQSFGQPTCCLSTLKTFESLHTAMTLVLQSFLVAWQTRIILT